MEKEFEFRKNMQQRTKQFALRVVKLFQALPKTNEANIIGKQLLRSATSIGANYRASCRARSPKEFYSKLSIVIEEADESMFWIELLAESNIVKSSLLQDLLNENEEIIKIIVSSRKKYQQNQNKPNE
jgi:four helix bundle protein